MASSKHWAMVKLRTLTGSNIPPGSSLEMRNRACLISYGPNFDDIFCRAAAYVNKIFKGAQPSDLPLEHPTQVGPGDQPESVRPRPHDSSRWCSSGRVG